MANRHKTSADLISAGEVYGKWTVLDVRSPSSLCECSCGVKRLIRNSFMLAGRVGGCHKCANNRSRPGRRSFKVSLSKEVYSKLSAVVRNAIKRCTDPAHSHWDYYGGRGIKVHTQWLERPELFVEYLASLEGHDDPSLVIDREDNDGDYAPGNLRFVRKTVSQQNKGPYKRRVYVA
jgi:hypothetical protein